MNTFLAITGALGGGVVFIASLMTVIRGLFKQVNAIDRNTSALDKLSQALETIESQVNSHAERISRLEGKIR